jgi:hypothetical protein
MAVRRLREAPASVGRDRTLADVLRELSTFFIRLGRLADAQTVLEESQALSAKHNLPLPPGLATDPLIVLGVVALTHGEYAETARLGEQARHRSEADGHTWNQSYAWYVFGGFVGTGPGAGMALMFRRAICALSR